MCRGLEQVLADPARRRSAIPFRPQEATYERDGCVAISPARPRSSAFGGHVESIDIFARNRYCTDLLLEHAAPLFSAEIAPGVVWIVRVQPPAQAGWAIELLSLVQRWLESARLPWATVLYGGRTCLIRPSTDIAQFLAAVEAPRGLPSLVTS